MYSAVVGFSSIAICVQSVISSVLRTPIIEAWEQLHAVISRVVDVCNAALTMRRSSNLNIFGGEYEDNEIYVHYLGPCLGKARERKKGRRKENCEIIDFFFYC